jgi:MFS family permease
MESSTTTAPHRDFTLLWSASAVSDLGSQVSVFAFPLLSYALTGSALWAAVIEAAYLIGLCGMLLPAGVLADRVDRRLILRSAAAVGALLYGSLVAAALLAEVSLPHLLTVALLTGIASGLTSPAELSAIRTVVSADHLPTALSQNQARQHVAHLLGGPLGGVLYGLTRWLPFAFDALTFAASWLALGRLRTDLSASSQRARRGVRRDIAEGIRFVLSWPYFRAQLLWSALVNLLVNALFFVAVLRLVQDGTDPTAIGLVSTAAGVAGIVGAVLAPWVIARIPTGMLVVAVAWSFVPGVVPMALWNNPVAVGAALATVMLLNPAANAGGAAYRIAHTPPDLQGRAQSANQFLSQSIVWLAPLTGGLLLERLGGRAALAVLGGLIALVALIPTLSRSIRAVPRPAVWRDQLAHRPTLTPVS